MNVGVRTVEKALAIKKADIELHEKVVVRSRSANFTTFHSGWTEQTLEPG
jgi:hypothetical protein